MTQGDIHRATGFERSYLSFLESNGVKYPRFSTIAKLCEALEVSLDEFLKAAISGNRKKNV